MRPFVFASAVVAIAATLLAQSAVPRTNKVSDDSVSALCTVTGRVVATADGNPLKSARVVLMPEHSRTDHEIYATSADGDGRFTIKDVPPGRYKFFAAHSGFVDQHYKAGNNDTWPLFSLHPGEKVTDVLFRLIAAAVITGRITNEDGDGMERVQVVALRRPTEEETEDEDELPRRHKTQMQPVASAESDDRGQYRIFGLKPGEYYIRTVDSPQPRVGRIPVEETFWVSQLLGSEYASMYCPGVAQISQAQGIPIKPGEEAQANVVMHRVKTVEIAGHVIGANGPSAHAFVSLTPFEGSDVDFDRQDTTDDKGSFRLKNIPEGSYYVIVFQRVEGSLGGLRVSRAAKD
ncbi:MAG: carboxypeptidase-like regulatory domain-containing protein [Candidatus Sulfotelmatobacter sp.]